ncbi:unnamed protein product [Lota lota]
MATSLLRIGRLGSLKALQLESWGVLRRPAAAALCTQGGEPPANQAKAQSKTVEAPDERASLLAYKTTVAFPVRLAPAGFSPAHPLGEPQPEAIPVAQTAEAIPAGRVDTITKAPPPVSEAAHPVYTDPAPQVAVEAPPSLPELVVTETPVVAKTLDDVTPAAATSAPPEGPSAGDGSSTSSSSSSDSDSDSDSDSEDSEEGVKTKTKESSATTPSGVEVGVSQDSVTPGDDVKDQTGAAERETPALETILVDTPPASDAQTTEVAEVTVDTAAAAAVTCEASEELVDSAPQISSAAEEPVADAAPRVQGPAAELPSDPQLTPDAPIETSPPPTSSSSSLETLSEGPAVLEAAAEAHVELETQATLEAAEAVPEAPPVEAVAEAPIEALEAEPATDAVEVTHAGEAKPAVEAEAPVAEESPEPVAPAEVAPEAAVKAAAPVEGADELVDPAPVLSEAAGEELQAEAPAEPEAVEASEAAAPEPEEPFDNSTYKNRQHHNYDTFTFVDLDLEMAKHRLPQPSSGRPSPQH